jgi:hypothetical protein
VKVNPVDDYQGLRVLESGLDDGQKVIVEGLQLVRPGQEVKVEEVPLAQFRHTAPRPYNADPRFSSKVSRLPGVDQPPPALEPAAKKAAPEPKKAEPESKKSTPDTKAEPEQRSGTAIEKKAR